jgi:hypothetical protein
MILHAIVRSLGKSCKHSPCGLRTSVDVTVVVAGMDTGWADRYGLIVGTYRQKWFQHEAFPTLSRMKVGYWRNRELGNYSFRYRIHWPRDCHCAFTLTADIACEVTARWWLSLLGYIFVAFLDFVYVNPLSKTGVLKLHLLKGHILMAEISAGHIHVSQSKVCILLQDMPTDISLRKHT